MRYHHYLILFILENNKFEGKIQQTTIKNISSPHFSKDFILQVSLSEKRLFFTFLNVE